MIKLIVTSSLIFLLGKSGYSQPSQKSLNTKEEYKIVLESISVIKEAKGDIPFKALLDKMNNALGLGITISLKKRTYLAISSRKTKRIHIQNPTNLDDVIKLSHYLKPLISKKLDSLKLNFDYAEFLGDFLLTMSNDNSWLMSKPVAISYYKRGGLLFSQGMSKDSLGNFLIKF